MSVFTTVSPEEFKRWAAQYPLGDLIELKGIASGISNTNYFVTTTTGRYVLTLFEEHALEDLVYFMELMTHLSDRGIPCPHPVAASQGHYLSMLNGKPAALVTCLPGRDLSDPKPVHCAEVGRTLANMHVAGQTFTQVTQNPRDRQWRENTAKRIMPFLTAADLTMLQEVLAVDAQCASLDLPTGVVHADLFRDNVLFDGDKLGGLIDFYYACQDAWLYDVAIAVNDWCVAADGTLDNARVSALLEAYQAVRPFTESELAAWGSIMQVAALRFWLSRLQDKHFPLAGELTHAKDPDHFKRILQHRMQTAHELKAATLS